MNKEQIQERLQTLEKERISAIAMYDGAIQDCQYWLKNLETPAPEIKE